MHRARIAGGQKLLTQELSLLLLHTVGGPVCNCKLVEPPVMAAKSWASAKAAAHAPTYTAREKEDFCSASCSQYGGWP